MGVSRNNGRGMKRRAYPDRSKLNLDAGLRLGFRSGLEEINAKHLKALGYPVDFESIKIPYTVPLTRHHYTPDFPLPNGILVETKGKLEPRDRAKHVYVKNQHPELDIRFVFQRPYDKIYKGSPTTYAAWADKNGFKWATRLIPEAWLKEAGPQRKPKEVLNERQLPHQVQAEG
ncbi:hypothetical protein [Agrobacterium sp. CFBP2214]|uniref:hypothetical protein n=1 Tax=Agrobacterium sp. CFBP2214 TaxID=3040274 RepID=UPI00254A91BE|nr:hypothetical protein [Agrobacterium sp. CFBP2214]